MSRIGKKTVVIPSGVEVKVEGNTVTVKGPRGVIQQTFHPKMAVKVEGGSVLVSAPANGKNYGALHGLTRSFIDNMVLGVTKGFEKSLEITGVGYRAQLQGRTLVLNLGFSHPVNVELPPGIEVNVDKQTLITIKGIDKYLVGQVAANIRTLKKPEPYKGKGIKYSDEHIRKKEGKTGK